MNKRDKIFIIATVIICIFFAIIILVYDTPIQKAAKEYVHEGDLTVYVYE